MRKALFSFFILLAGAFILTFSSTGCANIIPPSGGPRDSIPPQLIAATPGDSTLNFKASRITFTFDEYVDLQEVQNNLLFTPTFEINPEVSVRLKTVAVRFRDSLVPNTTYVLNFGNAIRDINESNPLRNFTYIFSTGNALDSLTLSGRVLLAENGQIDSTLMILLHRNLEDSAVIKQRPVYVARVGGDGTFRFTNLPRDTFAVYALGDAGIARRYQNKANQYFAFRNEPVVAGSSDSILLYAYKEAPVTTGAATANRSTPAPGGAERLRFSVASSTVDLQSDFIINFPVPIRNFDSTQLSLSTDTTYAPVPFTSRVDSAGTELRIRSQWREGTQYNLVLNRDFAEDSAGRKLLKTDTLNFNTKKLSDYGRLNIRIRNIDLARNPVLQFVQGSQIIQAVPIRDGGVYASRLFPPGEYELRILYDTNGNGKWDPGDFFGSKRQPEIVQPIRQNIAVKADWDNEFERSL